MENNQANNTEIKDELDDVVELRTVNSKHYRNGNGNYSAVIFDSPVHYLDEEDNTYKEIDMSLEEDNTRLFDGYKIKSNKFGVKFAKALSAQSLMVLEDRIGKIDISCGGYANRAMRLAANLGAVAKIDYTDKKMSARKRLLSQINATAFSAIRAAQTIPVVEKVKSIVEQRLEKFKKKASNIMYENAFVGADLEYVLSSNKIKENIIVGARAELYEYTFTIRLDGFDMQLATDGSGINIVSKADGVVKYIIPAPFMYDANETRSDAVMLKLDKISDGVFELGIVADKTWINAPERALPVVIDPQIISTETSDIIMNSYNNGVLVPSGDNLNALGRCYGTLYDMKVEIKTPNIVSKVFSNDTRVLNATIELSKAYDARRADSKGFNVLKDGRVIDHFTYNGSNNRIDINITNELNAAIKGKDESSVFDIQAVDRTSGEDDYMLILNSTDGNSEFRPKIMIDYVSDRLSLGASYHTSDVKRAGVGEVNLFNGNLTFTHTDLTAASNNLPFDLKHIYMSKLKGKEYDCEMYGNTEEKRLTPNFKMGKGWKMNIQQYLLKDEKDKTKATYLDGNGEVQLFEEKYFYEENGVRKFVRKDQCVENWDGNLSITIVEGNQQIVKSVTKALLTESGLLLFLNANGNMVELSESDTPIKKSYDLMYHGFKEQIIVQKGNKCVFTRYCRTYPYHYTYNNYHGTRIFHAYYSSSEVILNEHGKYCLKDDPSTTVSVDTQEYTVHNDNGQLYIYIPEPTHFSYYAGEVEQMTNVRFNLISDRKVDKIIFNTEAIMSLYQEISEIDSYIDDYRINDEKYAKAEGDLLVALENYVPIQIITDDLIKKEENEYNKLMSDYTQIQTDYNVDIRAMEEQQTILSKKLGDKQIEYSDAARELSNKKEESASSKRFSGAVATIKCSIAKDKEQKIYKEVNELSDELNNLCYKLNMEKIERDGKLEAKAGEINIKKEYIDNLVKLQALQDKEEQLLEIQKERKRIADKIQELAELTEPMYKEISVLIDQEKLNPIDYILDGKGNKFGFDFYGRLVEVLDQNDNKTTIEYHGDDITALNTRDGKIIRLEYYLGRLNKIFDTRQRMTLFEYNDNGFLSKIVYPDNQAVSLDGTYDNRITEFGYNQYNELEEARDQSGYAVKYTYNYFKQVETVKEYTYNLEISTDSFVLAETPIDGETVTIQYNNFKSTSVKNNRGVATTYVFDNAGRAVNIYRDDQFVSENTLNVTEAVSLSYQGRRKSYNVSVSQTAKNYVKNADFEKANTTDWIYANNSGDIYSVTSDGYVGGHNALRIKGNPQQARYAKQVIKAVDLPKGRNLIFAAWAKAQSAFIRSDRSSGYGDDIFENYNIDSFDPYKRDRKFGIRAEIKYEGYEPETMETTFDWYNTAWQFTALPIRLLKDRKLESITLYLDYTNNINSVLFDNIQLIEGEGEYKEFYEDGKLRYSTDGKVDSFYPDYHDGMPIREIKVDEEGNKYLNEYSYDQYKRLVRVVDHEGIVTEHSYTESGELFKTERYHKDDPCTKFVSETQFDEYGNVLREIDSRGKVGDETLSTSYSYVDGTGLVKMRSNTNDSDTTFAYDYANDKMLGISESDDGEDNKNLFEYKKGYLTRVYNDSTSFDYGYDGFGRSKFIKLNGKNYATYSYEEVTDGGEKCTVTLDNGEIITSQTDKFGNNTELQYAENGSTVSKTILSNSYDDNNRLVCRTDGLLDEVHSFEYDDRNRITAEQFLRSGVLIKSDITYDNMDNITKSSWQIDNEGFDYIYEYSKNVEPKLVSASLPNGTKSCYEYDPLGRKIATVLVNESGNTVMRQNTYYLKYGDHATQMPSAERFGIGGSLDDQIKYKYDKAGNITEIYKNGLLTNRYVYDKLNRMVREDNKALGTTVVCNYDTNGNILTKTVYAFTYGTLVEKMPVSVTPYSYRATLWRDQMTAYKGEKCEYDAIGYPTKYRNHIATFKYGGRMMSFDDNTYVYDASGERVSKVANGVETKYLIVAGKVVRSVTSGNVTDFFYDNYGISSIKYNGVSYFMRKNILGDVTHIYDTVGNLRAQYVYDAWGNHKVLDANGLEDTNQSSIGNINPIRYRGYFYDVETKLYYLKTRYYDPETGRFISADDTQFLEPNTVNGLNLYSYCGNNPVMNVDPNGQSITLAILGIVFGTVMGGVFGGLSEMAAGGSFPNGFCGGLVNGFISTVGLALGGALYAICPPLGLVVAGFAGVAGSIVGGIITNGMKTDWNYDKGFLDKDFWLSSIPSAILNGATNMLSLGLGNIMGAGKGAGSFLKQFGNWLEFGGFAFSAAMIIGFPMFAIGLIPIMLMASSKKETRHGKA